MSVDENKTKQRQRTAAYFGDCEGGVTYGAEGVARDQKKGKA